MRALLLVFLGSISLFAQLRDASNLNLEENRIRQIRVEGVRIMEPRAVLSRMSISEGQSLHPSVLYEKIRISVQALWDSEFFDDVRIGIEYAESGVELDVVVVVSERPSLESWSIQGNRDISEEDLKPKVLLANGQIYGPTDVERSRQAILSHYRSEGFLLAEVAVHETPIDETRNKIVFDIHEGRKVKIEAIRVQGNDNIPVDEILSAMQSKKDRWYSAGEFKEDVFESDRDSVINTARRFGFLDAALLEYRAEYMPDSSWNFYRGRALAPGANLQVLLEQVNTAISNKDHPFHTLAGRTLIKASPHHRRHRSVFQDKAQAIPVPNFRDENQLVSFFNHVLNFSQMREEWILSRQEKMRGQNRELDSLLALENPVAFNRKRIARLMFEKEFPPLMPADSINSSSKVQIHINLQEGRRYYAGVVSFTGNEVLSLQALQSVVQLDSGKVFDYRKYQNTQASLMAIYREDGYLFVQLDEKRTFRDSIVDIAFTVVEGLPAQIRKVIVRGNTRTKDKVIRREVKLFPGDTYRQSLMERSFRDIMQLNFFDNVAPDIELAGNQDVDLVFRVVEKEAGTGTFSAGLAFSQADNLVGTLGLAIPNCCMGDGRNATLNVEYGGLRKNYSVGFSEPFLMDTPTRVGGSVNYSWWEGRNQDNDIVRWGFRGFLGRRLTWPDDYFYAQTDYAFQINQQGNNVEGSLVRNSGLESSISATIIRDDKNLPIFPTDGSRYTVTVQKAGLGGDFNFIKTDISMKWWFPIWGSLALGIHNELGFITGDAIQYRTMYLMGGALGYQGMLRGYAPGSIGYRRLGRSYQSFVAEMTYPVAVNRFYLLGFFDAGNVFGPRYNPSEPVPVEQPAPWTYWDPTNLKRDYGFGFRVIVPMLGIIGFDFAWPLDPGETFNGLDSPGVGPMEFNFVIGQGF